MPFVSKASPSHRRGTGALLGIGDLDVDIILEVGTLSDNEKPLLC